MGTYFQHKISIPPIKCFPLNLTDKPATIEFLTHHRPQIVFHSAAAVNVDECETNRKPTFATNVEATKTLVDTVSKWNALVVYISSDAFFDGGTGSFKESDTPTPINYYGETKLLAEEYIKNNSAQYLNIRTNLYGWNYQPKLSFAEWILVNIYNKKHIPLVNDVFYTPILTNKLVQAVAELIKRKKQGTYNITSSRRISKYEFANILCTIFELDPSFIDKASVKTLKLIAKRSENMALDNTKVATELPEISFEVEDHLREFKDKYLNGYVQKLRGESALPKLF